MPASPSAVCATVKGKPGVVADCPEELFPREERERPLTIPRNTPVKVPTIIIATMLASTAMAKMFSSMTARLPNHLHAAHVGPQRGGEGHGAVGLLIGLQHRDHDPGDGQRGAVEGVGELGPGLPAGRPGAGA